MVQLVDLIGILSVTLAEVVQLLLEVLLLGDKLRVQVLMLRKVGLEFSDLGVAAIEDILLRVELSEEVGVLLLAVNQQVLLIVDLLSQGRDHVDVDFDAALIVVLHAALLVGDAVEVLLEGKQLVLEELVLALSLTQLHGLGTKLSYEAVLVVLRQGGVVQFSFGAVRHF